MIIPTHIECSATIYCSLPFPNAPPSPGAAAVIGRVWVRCRHRPEPPFISALGRWTRHLISNKGNFSILQPAYSDAATDLGFYHRSSPASASLLLKTPLLIPGGLCFTFSPWIFPLCTGESERGRQQWRRAFNKEACGSLFAFFF